MVCGLGLGITLKSGVWLPDVATGRTIALASVTTTNDDSLSLVQVWVGDGYATRFFHTNRAGRGWYFAVDGDAPKAWSGQLAISNSTVEISVLNQRYFYDLGSHIITDIYRTPQLILEIPEDGSPVFLIPHEKE